MTPRAVVFDLYGTILAIDEMRGAVQAAGARDARAFVDAWRRKQLEYTFLCSLGNAYRDFDELTALALAHTCELHGLALDAGARERLTLAWSTLPAYPDVAPALQALAARGIPAAVLTNGTPAAVETVLERAGLRRHFEAVLSADAARVYKPNPRVYELATSRFACEPGAIAFVSSNGWDAWGATQFGFRVAWCNRSAQPHETLAPLPAETIDGLERLGDVLDSRARRV